MTSNKRTPSTTSRWEYRKILVRSAAPRDHAAEGSPSPSLARWNRRDALTITVKYRGGAEAWIELKARGRTVHCVGSTFLFDALERLWEGSGGA